MIRHLEKAYVLKKKVTETFEREQKKIEKVPSKINRKEIRSLKTDDLSVITELKKDRSLFTSIPLDRKHTISSFEFIGLADPNEKNPIKSLKWLKSLHHDVLIYPAECYDPEQKKPPSCLFVPEPALMNKMIEAAARYHDNVPMLYAKFNTMEMPMP